MAARRSLWILAGIVALAWPRGASAQSPARERRIRLHIQLSETELGIPVERQARLFTPYEQGDASVSRQFGGTGLGLASSQRLAGLLRSFAAD